MKQSDDENTVTIDGVFSHKALKETGPLDCLNCSFRQGIFETYCPTVPCRHTQRKDKTSVYFIEVKNVKTKKEI